MQFNIKSNLQNPYYIAGGMLAILLVIYALFYLLSILSGMAVDKQEIWVYICTAYLAYTIYASIFLVMASNTEAYLRKTLLAFVGLLALGLGLGTLISGESVFSNDAYREVFLSVMIGSGAFISLASLASQIVKWTKQRDEKFLKDDKWDQNREN